MHPKTWVIIYSYHKWFSGDKAGACAHSIASKNHDILSFPYREGLLLFQATIDRTSTRHQHVPIAVTIIKIN